MLELKDVFFSVPVAEGKQRHIIDGVSFLFEKGNFYVITGPNGSGKTTLAKLIMGINPVTSGAILFEGADINLHSITERARSGIAYSFQHPARFKGITFRDLLAMAAGSEDEAKLWTIDPMVRILKREQAEHKTATIVISHNRAFLEAADRYSKRSVRFEPNSISGGVWRLML